MAKYIRKEQKEAFINHLKELMLLKDDCRRKRSDWRMLKRILIMYGYWRKRRRKRPPKNFAENWKNYQDKKLKEMGQ